MFRKFFDVDMFKISKEFALRNDATLWDKICVSSHDL